MDHQAVAAWTSQVVRYGSGISTPHGGRQTMPVSGHSPRQRIPVVGRHADPGGKPNTTQSASFRHGTQRGCPIWAQKLLFPVVLRQAQVSEPLHRAIVGVSEHNPGKSWLQVPVS